MARYVIGIDLGTTNSALAFVDLQAKVKGGVKLQTYPVTQLVQAGQIGTQPLLPSFLYLPSEHDLPAGATSLPWNAQAKEIVGQFARLHGAKIPGRLVSSAKSWLCHPGVDRTAPLLPWGALEEVERLSPLAVSAKYLQHLADSWNHAKGRSPADFLQKCPVVLTVPASFDDVARNLTAEAAKQVGFENLTLLEEPQAAFYCWLGMHPKEEGGKLKPGMRCVVVDIGGGTSDFSLIRCQEEQGDMTFIRDAVGDHLLLGGDNMDLALAKVVEEKLKTRLDAGQFGSLIQACRQAKETLLGPEAPGEIPVTVVGRGRSVIAGTLSTSLTKADVERVLFDGFLPMVDLSATPLKSNRSGLQEMGLPYVADAAMTKHLADFLRNHLTAETPPDAILFNGGVFQPESLRHRIVSVMKHWFQSSHPGWEPVVLTNPSLDLAVAWGAAYAAWLKQTGGRRIGGGTAKSYYIGVAGSESEAVASDVVRVICVVPRRMQEGEENPIPEPELELTLGQPVIFPLYSSTVRSDDQPGDVLLVQANQLLQMPPLHTILRGGKRAGAKQVPVTLLAKSTEIGTLELYCVSQENNRWRLEFNVRDVFRDQTKSGNVEDNPEPLQILDVFPEEKILLAGEKIRGCYRAGKLTPAELTKQLEECLEMGRSQWPMALCRRLWDYLAEVSPERAKSPGHLSRWYNLAGFCLRPGFGDTVDRYRVEAVWKTITSTASGAISGGGGKKLAVPEGGADYWIMWRRIAGGLNGALQQALLARIRQTLLPGKGGKVLAKASSNNELAEMWRAVASLERLDTRTKLQLGDTLLKQLGKTQVPNYLFWSLTRIGARVQFYGPLNTILHPDVVEGWLTKLLDFDPQNENDRLAWGFCLAQLARKSGIRGVDVPVGVQEAIADFLLGHKMPEAWVRMVQEFVPSESDEDSRLFGESLPIGLRLTGQNFG